MALALSFGITLGAEGAQPFAVPDTSVHTLRTGVGERSYDIYVKTPVGYHAPENVKRHYPVIYLNDGPYTFQVASGATHLPMGGAHKLERVILVGVSFATNEGIKEGGMASRVRDLTPVADPDWKRYQTGGAPAYLEFLETRVIDFVEANYRADASRRALSGQSLGGSFGVWVLLTRPELFSSYLLTSPSLWFSDRFIFDLEKRFAANHKDLRARVYLAVGGQETRDSGMRQDMVDDLLEFTDALRARHYEGLSLKVEVIPDALHETTFPQGFMRGAQWLWGRQ